jgi:hypothetical protein
LVEKGAEAMRYLLPGQPPAAAAPELLVLGNSCFMLMI